MIAHSLCIRAWSDQDLQYLPKPVGQVMQKRLMPYANNKGTDQPAHKKMDFSIVDFVLLQMHSTAIQQRQISGVWFEAPYCSMYI